MINKMRPLYIVAIQKLYEVSVSARVHSDVETFQLVEERLSVRKVALEWSISAVTVFLFLKEEE
jgi:hypothetical protein